MKDIFKNHWWICRDFINELFYSITLGLKFVKNRTAVVKVDSNKSLNVNLREREKKNAHI